MNHTSAVTCTATNLRFYPCGHLKFSDFRDARKVFDGGFGLVFQRKVLRRLKFVVSAELPRDLTLDLGLDSQTFQPHDVTQLRWIGPVPGDIAEVEAYCRIFRAAERLHTTLMNTLCDPITGECTVSYDFSSEVLEDKIVSVLGCMISLLNKGRRDVLSGRSSIMTSFRVEDMSTMDDNLPPLATFRSEIKRCCESLHVALENYLMPGDVSSHDVWRKLQQLKNVCYDLGFSRGDDSPSQMLFANWAPVSISNSKENNEVTDSEVEFWKGGQVTEEGLKWLLDKGFRTIVDIRAETVKDNFYQAAIDDAVQSGKVELFKFPVEIGTVPSVEQVEKFASLVSDPARRPIYLHSKEGVWRTSSMISRWRQYMVRCESQLVASSSVAPNGTSAQGAEGMSLADVSSGVDIDIENQSAGRNTSSGNTTEHLRAPNGILHNQNSGVMAKNIPESVHFVDSEFPPSDDDANLTMQAYAESVNVNPFKSQLPPNNVFSKKEMSSFFKSRKISPSTFVNSQRRRSQSLPAFKEARRSTSEIVEEVKKDSLSVSTGKRNPNGSTQSKELPLLDQSNSIFNEKGTTLSHKSRTSASTNVNGNGSPVMSNTVLTGPNKISVGNESNLKTAESDQKNNGRPSRNSDLEVIGGNMCASATGVVRIQSRKKAEMFLVRTDGFSCTREKVTESSLAFTHPSTQQQMLMWKSTPKTVLLLKKLGPELMEEAKEVASYLYYQEKMNVLVEPDVHDIFARMPGFGFVQTFYGQDSSELHEKVDFVACLGGDGVILHASNLFRGAVPPVVSFNLGSLGFLTSHNFQDYKQDLRQVIHGNNTRDGVYITLRMRLRCEVFRNGKAMAGKVFDVLNEIVVDRGSNPYLSKIECYEHDRLITKVQGDGIIVATPTGSTAYSTAAGGSMVHPNVPCMLFTPICPHSLSFRPVILPDSARLELKIPDDARSNAWVSFDGKRRQQLSRGDSVRISMSQHPLPTVNKSDQTGDWFRSLIRCLNWNERMDQKAF
ncbi:hypothetical protein RND81_01G166600 [Saponaria officinalis]|uniref:NAD(+) kinase n=1 Tax=Saponaria officinalis TaxID=3572 RepID=A0AAW1NJ87_SAPOF